KLRLADQRIRAWCVAMCAQLPGALAHHRGAHQRLLAAWSTRRLAACVRCRLVTGGCACVAEAVAGISESKGATEWCRPATLARGGGALGGIATGASVGAHAV